MGKTAKNITIAILTILLAFATFWLVMAGVHKNDPVKEFNSWTPEKTQTEQTEDVQESHDEIILDHGYKLVA